MTLEVIETTLTRGDRPCWWTWQRMLGMTWDIQEYQQLEEVLNAICEQGTSTLDVQE